MPERGLSPFSFIGLVAGLLFAVFPIFWMVSTSFKVRSEWVTSPPTWISSRPTVDNYLTILAPHVLHIYREIRFLYATDEKDFGKWKNVVDHLDIYININQK